MRSFLALAAITGLVVPSQQAPDRTVERKYESPEGYVMEGLGGCEIGPPARVVCWDMDGKPNQPLALRIAEGLQRNSGNEISYRFGSRPRYIVVQRRAPAGIQPYPNYTIEEFGYASSMSLNDASQGSGIDLLRVNAPESAKVVNLIAAISNLDKPKTATMAFRSGEKGSLPGRTLTLSSTKELKTAPVPPYHFGGYGTQPMTGKTWGVFFSVEGANQAVTLYPMGRDGKAIQYVDDKGNPVPAVKVLEESRRSPGNTIEGGFNGMPFQAVGRYRPVMMFVSERQVQGAEMWVTNVNPSHIGSLTLTTSPGRTVKITGFPLEPTL